MSSLNKAIDAKILDPETHSRLLEDLDRVCTAAGVLKKFIYDPLLEHSTPEVVEWVTNIRLQQGGLALVGKRRKPIEMEMMAIAAACIRNFIDARVLTLQQVLRGMGEASVQTPSVLLIPNFYVPRMDDSKLPHWQTSQVMDLLITRMAAGKPSIVYIQDWAGVSREYGPAMQTHIENHYTILVDQ